MHEPAEDRAIDHVLYGAPDLDEGIDRIERLLGARPAPGGRHPAYGTHNAVLALGPACYLEVIAPELGLPAPARGIGFGVQGLAASRLVTWAMRHPAIEEAAALAGLGAVESGCRERVDGTVLSWRLTDPYAERMEGVVPLLIDWGETPHPASSAPSGGRLVGLRLEHPSAAGVRDRLDLLGVEGIEVEVARADEPRLVARIETPTRTVELA
jgi:hypothetical protein